MYIRPAYEAGLMQVRAILGQKIMCAPRIISRWPIPVPTAFAGPLPLS